ncbi:MAG: ATP-dependent DNA ligase [Planctomycetota bacterium]
MKQFSELYRRLDSTTKTNEKIEAMVEYFSTAEPKDIAWAVHFLSGAKLRRQLPSRLLRAIAAEQAGIPDWLLDECYHVVGDLAETLSLAVPPGNSTSDQSLHWWVEERLKPIASMGEDEQIDAVKAIWSETPPGMRLVIMKLVTGAFRVGVSKRLVTRALAKHCNLSPDVIAHRLMGDWQPSESFYESLVHPDDGDTLISQPYPFCLAHPLDIDGDPADLGSVEEYAAEWKWDGIRGQVIRRQGETFIWSRGEDLMENRWPEIEDAAQTLPDGTVIDGEILASLQDGTVLPFGQLQRRIGRKTVGKKLLKEVPVIFHTFDLLELGGEDLRSQPLETRRKRLEELLDQIDHPHLRATEWIINKSWTQLASLRQTSRERHAEGLMLKRLNGVYDVGRVRGNWWKWKIEPYTVDAVLIYAQKGHGKRSGLFTDYTFAVWDNEKLVPFARAYSGLDDAEIRKVDRFIRQNTNDTFGPVRAVTPELVMELAFEGLQRSSRHKSGIATRFPRIVRWRHDKKPVDANTLSELLEMLPTD